MMQGVERLHACEDAERSRDTETYGQYGCDTDPYTGASGPGVAVIGYWHFPFGFVFTKGYEPECAFANPMKEVDDDELDDDLQSKS